MAAVTLALDDCLEKRGEMDWSIDGLETGLEDLGLEPQAGAS